MKCLSGNFRLCAAVSLLILLGQVSRAQSVSVGFKGGLLLNSDMEYVSSGGSESKRYILGPAIEFQLTSKAALEVSALYRRVGYTSGSFYTYYKNWIRSNSWEFPFIGKYYISSADKFTRPYISGGFVLKHLSEAKGIIEEFSFPNNQPIRMQTNMRLNSNPNQGLTVGGGLNVRSGRIRFSPEFRYTRWFTVPFDESGSRAYQVTSSANQMDILLKLSFVAHGK
jgi:hypothetical protein